MPVPSSAILPLRAFLGLTFLYASIQKVADPGFLHPGSRTYIETQVISFSHHSPIGSLLRWLVVSHPTRAGFAIIAVEWAIGIFVLLGLFTRLAATMGAAVNFSLFLSASWNVYPYFLGSDIVFVVCWLTLLLAGPGPLSVDSFLHRTPTRAPTTYYVATHPPGKA